MLPRRTLVTLALAGALGFGLAACGSSTSSKSSTATTAAPAGAGTTAAAGTTVAPDTTAAAPATSAPPAAGATTVHIKNFAFSPTPLQVTAGQTVTIANDDTVAHTFTADAGGFDTGPIAAGATATVTVSATGSVGYHCKIHTSMKGTLQVA